MRWRPQVSMVRAGTYVALMICSTAALAPTPPLEFRAAMDQAIMRMHHAMAAPADGQVDEQFARMMIAHHQGAVDMAVLQIRYGSDERLRRLAQGIIVEQQQEIRLMERVLAELAPASAVEAKEARQ